MTQSDKKALEEFDEKIKSWKDEIGDIPENTCPSLDNVIKDIQSFSNEVEYLRKNANRYDGVDELAKDLPCFGWNDPTSEIDGKLRHDNEKLRELGIFWYENCKNLKSFILKTRQEARDEEHQRIVEMAWGDEERM